MIHVLLGHLHLRTQAQAVHRAFRRTRTRQQNAGAAGIAVDPCLGPAEGCGCESQLGQGGRALRAGGIRRAGADFILTYFATSAARVVRRGWE